MNAPHEHQGPAQGFAGEGALDVSIRSRLGVLSEHVRALVAQRKAGDPDPDNPYRGLYVTDEEADALSEETGSRAAASSMEGFESLPVPDERSALGKLAASFELDALDLDLLMIALAPEIEPRFEKLYGYLHDDLTRRRASIGLAIELTGYGFADARVRARLGVGSRLVSRGLLVVEDSSRSMLTRSLRVADRVIDHLFAHADDDEVIRSLTISSVGVDDPEVDQLASIVSSATALVYMQDVTAGIGPAIAAEAMRRCGRETLTIDFARMARDADAMALVRGVIREARLANKALVVILTNEIVELYPELAGVLATSRWPTIVVGHSPWNPAWSNGEVLTAIASRRSVGATASIWTNEFPALAADVIAEATCQLRLRPDQIVRAAALARKSAASLHEPVSGRHLQDAARAQNSAKLERLARRIRPTVSWNDLILTPEVERQLREVEVRYRHRDTVHGEWGLGGSNNRRLGVVALFAGPSGVGKSMGAEALAGALGLDLYQVNLATVVDKYIGETEKNLERIFEAAEGVNGVILFDEADALFGKRSEVSDAKDRYANVEVAYLLQRLETYEGVAVLATNLRTNIDDAFTRRLDAVVDFPEPTEAQRLTLWNRCLGTVVNRDADVDIEFLAAQFRFSGGNIRNIAVAAAFLAVARGRTVSMEDLVRATAQEYRKLGRLCTSAEFGRWLATANS